MAKRDEPVVKVLESETTVGIIANPASGRDIRRLVACASVFPVAEKCNMITRLLRRWAQPEWSGC